jgi:D-alanyl-D-alanine carboxypeptidase/D-alanyl-D-alanine-endopeptidase (penicillin-binding protein 4)
MAFQVAPATGQSASPDAIGSALDRWHAAAEKRAPGTWGVVVADESGEVLWSRNADRGMTPASTVKILTTGFARTVVGGTARRATRVVGTGAVNPATGAWEGHWALELNGDPTLERPDRAGPSLRSLARQLHQIGVRQLIGPLTLTTQVGEPSARYPGAWSTRHRGRAFAPPVGPVTLNENLVAFTIAPGSSAGEAPIVRADAPRGASRLVTMEARTVTGTRNRLVVRQRAGGGWTVTGTIGTRAAARRYAYVAPSPVAVVEAVWAQALADVGIAWSKVPAVRAVATGERRILAEIASAPFDSIAHEVNVRSVNIGAELLLLWGGGADRPASRLEAHVRAVTGLDHGIRLVDGSGLSDDDRVSAGVFARYLARFPRTAAGRDFPLLFPANGSGTLRRLATGLPESGVVRAKTGTLANVSTLVGYLGRSEGMLIVAALYNGPRAGDARLAQWELFRTLGADGVVIPAEPDVAPVESFGGP